MAVMARSMPYARTEGGLATAFITPPAGPTQPMSVRPFRWGVGPVVSTVGGVALAAVLAAVGRGALGLAAVGAEALAAAAVGWLAWRRIGGFTGDVLGAPG